MSFNHLHVPDHFQVAMSKYPHGLSMLESLLSWVSQVDEMVDAYNLTRAEFEALQKTVDTAIETLWATVVPETISETLDLWYSNGKLGTVINNTLLNSKADKTTTDALAASITALESEIDTTIADALIQLPKSVTDFLTPAERADIKLATPLLDHSASIQAYVNAMAATGKYVLTFPAGNYRFKNIALGAKEWSIEGASSSGGYLQDTRFKIIAATNGWAFTGANRMLSMKNIRTESTGNKADGLNVGFYKNTLGNGNFVHFENCNLSKFSGTLFECRDLIDSTWRDVKIDQVGKCFKFILDQWTRHTTVLFERLYITNATTVFECNNTTESRMEDLIIEFCGLGSITVGKWTIDNVYFEYNTSKLNAADSRILRGAIFSLTENDTIINTDNNLPYYDKGAVDITHNKVKARRIEADYRASGLAIESNYDTGIWWEIGEWVANKAGAQMKINFNGPAGYGQQVGGNGTLAGVGESTLYVTQTNNGDPGKPNCVSWLKQAGSTPPVNAVKIKSTDPSRTMFKVYVKTNPYTARVALDVQVGIGYFVPSMIENVADPGAASSTIAIAPIS